MRVEFPERPLFETPNAGLGPGRGVGAVDAEGHWLAGDPLHAALYGTSLRMAAARDVFVEGTKDAAIGMYDRGRSRSGPVIACSVSRCSRLSADQLRDVGRDISSIT